MKNRPAVDDRPPARAPVTLAISNQMFAVMRALRDRRDPKDGLFKRGDKARVDKAIDRLKARRLITHTNIIADPWRLTHHGEELLRLRDLGEERARERERRSWGVHGVKR